MNAAIQSLDFKIKGIQTNANEDVTNAENEVAKARNQLSASKENVGRLRSTICIC
jgi:hypothetical protein